MKRLFILLFLFCQFAIAGGPSGIGPIEIGMRKSEVLKIQDERFKIKLKQQDYAELQFFPDEAGQPSSTVLGVVGIKGSITFKNDLVEIIQFGFRPDGNEERFVRDMMTKKYGRGLKSNKIIAAYKCSSGFPEKVYESYNEQKWVRDKSPRIISVLSVYSEPECIGHMTRDGAAVMLNFSDNLSYFSISELKSSSIKNPF